MQSTPPGWIMVSRTSTEGLLLYGPEPLPRYRYARWHERWRRAPCSPDTLAVVNHLDPNFSARLSSLCNSYTQTLPPPDTEGRADPWQALRDACQYWIMLAMMTDVLKNLAAGPLDYGRRLATPSAQMRSAHIASAEELIAWFGALRASINVTSARTPARAAASFATKRGAAVALDGDDSGDQKRRAVDTPDPPE